jgi:hypothetical protein
MNKLTPLQKLAIAVGIFISLGTVANTLGVVYVANYRLAKTEAEQIKDRVTIEQVLAKAQDNAFRLIIAERTVAENKAEVKIMREQGSADKSLLIRIDERLRQVQAALKLSTYSD